MNVNQVHVIGRMARDAEIRSLTTGGAVCSFTKAGKKVEQPEFHSVAAFGKTAELIAQYGKKGRLLMVEGRLRTNSWEKDGQTHYRTEIIADRIQLGPKAEKKAEPVMEMVADPSHEPMPAEPAVAV